MSGDEMNNIQIYRKKWHINIGIIIFGIIFIYLLFTILTYVTARHVSMYEVRDGSIWKDTAYTGIILREETVIPAEAGGYVNYFVAENSKVGKKTGVYCISPEKIDFESEASPDDETEASAELTSEEQAAVLLKTQTFSESFTEGQFSDTYNLKDSIENIITSNSNQSRQSQLDTMLQSGQEGLSVHTAADDGIIVYSVDGYEALKMDQVTEDTFVRSNYEQTELFNNTKIQTGDPVYKLITSENWTLVIELDDETAQEMAETTSVKVRFAKDSETTRASFSIYNTEHANLGFLTFDHSMVRYANQRFLDIELIMEDETGLKIPKSAVIEKDFYTVPEEYLTQGGNTTGTGVLIQGEKDTTQFQTVDVYYRDNETGMVYLNPNTLEEGTVLIKPESNESYPLKKTAPLSGVYNINKGYAMFCQIHILCESEEYYIVESGNEYGLSNYDHIALDGDKILENDVVF